MKKIIKVSASTLVFTLFAIQLYAQDLCRIAGASKPEREATNATIDKPIPETKLPGKVWNKININAVQHFTTNYPGVSNEKWQALKDGYMAAFVSDSIPTKLYYDKTGTWLHSIQRFDEAKLPKEVRASVRSAYYDYAITGVDKVSLRGNGSKPRYLVYIRHNNTFKTILVCDGEVQEMTLQQ
jgi:hypothetical protein